MAGVALRSEIYDPALIRRVAVLADSSEVDSIWYPDVKYDAIELAALTLASTRRVVVGTGVIRLLEHDPDQVSRRAYLLNSWSAGRFVLGVGTGANLGARSVQALVAAHEKLRSAYPGSTKPVVVYSALRQGMYRAALSGADGVLFNFCSPAYLRRLLDKYPPRPSFLTAVYIKAFYSENSALAKKMLVEEFRRYAQYPHYARMFLEMGVEPAVASLREELPVPPELQDVVLLNPTANELAELIKKFRDAGVNLPVVYPYIFGDDDEKLRHFGEIFQSLAPFSGYPWKGERA